MDDLRIQCLGCFRPTREGDLLTGFHSGKAQALLCYLAVTGRAHSRSALAGLLWRDLSEANARANLRKILSNLRRLVGPHLAITRYEVGINHETEFWLDVAEFEAGVAPGAPIEQIEKAVSLYQGDFLYGFDVRGAPAFEEWSLSQRARLRELAAQALDILVTHFTVEHNYVTAIQHAKHLLSIEPWREEAHRQLIRLLAQTGQRSAALKQYETCRRLLWEELGVEPDAETQALYKAICSDELDKIIDTPSPHYQVTSALKQPRILHNLPSQSTPFIGRPAELADLYELMINPGVRLVTILGTGGMGKTRLALAAAEAQLDHFANGVYFVSLASLQDAASIVPAIAQEVNFSFYDGGTPLEQILNYLRQKQMLLVMDNFEHLLDGVDIIADILQKAPGVKVLVTSRAKLNLQGEYLFHIAGMAIPETLFAEASETGVGADEVEDAQQYGAIELFLQSAQRARPGYQLAADDWTTIVRICQLIQGMPLGILLAAAWIEMLTPREIADKIDQSLDFLETDMRDVPDRHQSMRAVFDSSWNFISERERLVFAALSVFRGGFTLPAAQEATGASLRELMSLVDKSLVYRDSEGRFAVHELLRQYAADYLSQSPADYEAVRDRHSAFYCADLKRREAEWKSGKEVAAFAAIELDFENVRSAWGWAADHGQFIWLDQAMDSLGEFYSWQARYLEGEVAFAQATNNLQTLTSGSSDVPNEALLVHAKALVWQAEFNREYLGYHDRAVQLLLQSQVLLERPELAGHDTRKERAFHLVQSARIARDEGEQEKNTQLWQESLRLSEELGDQEWIAYKTGGLAWNAIREGNYDEAHRWFQKVQVMWQELDNTMYITNLLGGLGLVALIRGQLEESERLLRERMAISLERGKLEKLVNPYFQLGETLMYRGKFTEAQAILDEGLEIYHESGRIGAAVEFHEHLAIVKAHLGRYEQSRIQAQETYTLRQKLGHPIGIASALYVLGKVSLAEKAYVEARQLLQESVALFQSIERQDMLYCPTRIGAKCSSQALYNNIT
jgi:predicted ATPase/DNA-binding SARP family transcriptional activator